MKTHRNKNINNGNTPIFYAKHLAFNRNFAIFALSNGNLAVRI